MPIKRTAPSIAYVRSPMAAGPRRAVMVTARRHAPAPGSAMSRGGGGPFAPPPPGSPPHPAPPAAAHRALPQGPRRARRIEQQRLIGDGLVQQGLIRIGHPSTPNCSPASCGSNAGRASFASSLSSSYWASAKGSHRRRRKRQRRRANTRGRHREGRGPAASGAWPTFVIRRWSGTTRSAPSARQRMHPQTG